MTVGLYQWNDFSVREHATRGGGADLTKPDDSAIPLGSKLIFFIHGFNVNESEARVSYASVFNRLVSAGFPKQLHRNICRFFWPGNTRNPILSALSYPFQIKTAKESAQKLATYLMELHAKSPLTEFVFVAHSLGCRLLLEMLTEILNNRPEFRASLHFIVMMAAAVPVRMVEIQTSEFGATIGKCKTRVLFSPHDLVLRGAFPPGQTAAGEGILPEAVGLHGNPRPLWWHCRNEKIGHGDYWESKHVGNYIAESLSYAPGRTLPVNDLPARPLPKYVIGK
jgi:hypothetical protein